jgi:hypothetical protein
MDRKGKGKQVAGSDSYSGGQKRKNSVEFRDEGLRIKKRKNPEVLQFFEESAEVGYYGGSSDEDDDGLGFLNGNLSLSSLGSLIFFFAWFHCFVSSFVRSPIVSVFVSTEIFTI